jgi:two-component system alkaline phosphatase synthesis response regulator PhoP
MPVIMLTARGEEFDRVLGLEIGADDYITKPFSAREVVARIRAVLRRSAPQEGVPAGMTLHAGDLLVDLDRRIVTKGGSELIMPMKEFDLLRYLIENRGRVLTREQLLDHVWGYDYIGETRTVDVHVRHLRMKVEDDADNPTLIETVRGIGYRLATK